MPGASNQAWNLESFLDSLIVELDKAQDTLSYKGITRKLTYTVKDMALDLQIFPQFDGRKVRFLTAQPGEAGASKISIQFGSITDRQIKDSTKEPLSRDDITIDDIDGLDTDTKDSLRKVGITSAGDLERVENKNVDVGNALKEKASKAPDSDKGGVNYSNLANMIQQAKRKRQLSPKVLSVGLTDAPEGRVLTLSGENLLVPDAHRRLSALSYGESIEEEPFPVAVLDGERIPILEATQRYLRLSLPEGKLHDSSSTLKVALDPFAVITMEINP